MDPQNRNRIVKVRVDAERAERRAAGADLAAEDWRSRCEAFHVLSLSPDARGYYLDLVARRRNPLAAVRLSDDALALERELFTAETEDAFADLFA